MVCFLIPLAFSQEYDIININIFYILLLFNTVEVKFLQDREFTISKYQNWTIALSLISIIVYLISCYVYRTYLKSNLSIFFASYTVLALNVILLKLLSKKFQSHIINISIFVIITSFLIVPSMRYDVPVPSGIHASFALLGIFALIIYIAVSKNEFIGLYRDMIYYIALVQGTILIGLFMLIGYFAKFFK